MSHPLDCACGERAIYHIETTTAYCPFCEAMWNPTAEFIDLGRPDDWSHEAVTRWVDEVVRRIDAVIDRQGETA